MSSAADTLPLWLRPRSTFGAPQTVRSPESLAALAAATVVGNSAIDAFHVSASSMSSGVVGSCAMSRI